MLTNDLKVSKNPFRITNDKIEGDLADFDLVGDNYNIESFPDPSVRSDQIFDHLEIEKQVYDSCANGKNLTLFSLENKQSTKGLS